MYRVYLRSEIYVSFFTVLYLHKLFGTVMHGKISVHVYLYMQAFISLWNSECLFYVLIYNPILLYFIAQTVPVLAMWGFPVVFCGPLTYFFYLLLLYLALSHILALQYVLDSSCTLFLPWSLIHSFLQGAQFLSLANGIGNLLWTVTALTDAEPLLLDSLSCQSKQI